MRQSVFRSQSQVLELRQLFYSEDELEQRRALALCRAYETRYRLPVSVHLTALIVAALLADTPLNDLYAIRLGYSAALIRLVNEVLDSAQQGKMAAPLHALALMLDLPSSFVEARHAATHEELPTVDVLRELVRRALGWLNEHFWALQVVHTPKLVDGDSKTLLSLWRRSRRANVQGPITADQRAVAKTLRRHFSSSKPECMGAILDKLLKTDKIEPAAALWLPLFEAMDVVGELGLELLNELGQSDWTPGQPMDDRQELICCWVEHLIGVGPRPELLTALSSAPRPWNARGLAAYSKYEQSAHTKAEKMARFCGITIAMPQETHKKIKPCKWKTVENWTPRPLGV